jgi:hypothetical protein
MHVAHCGTYILTPSANMLMSAAPSQAHERVQTQRAQQSAAQSRMHERRRRGGGLG